LAGIAILNTVALDALSLDACDQLKNMIMIPTNSFDILLAHR
jgi:hypothetical protein